MIQGMDPPDHDEPARVPRAVHELLRKQVQSFEQLEVLLLVCGDPDRTWTPAEAAAALNWSMDPTKDALLRLQGGGVLGSPSPGAYRFEPSTPALAEAISELRRCCTTDRLAILKLMNDLALEQMRNAMLRTLAEAFRLRRREP